MTRYVLQRIGQAVLVLWAAYTVTFAILYLLPGDPVALMLSANNIEVDSLTPQEREVAAARLGLDRPLWEQYLGMLGAALRGDFGIVLRQGHPGDRAARAAPPQHRSCSASIAIVLALGVRRGDRADRRVAAARAAGRPVSGGLPAIGVSVPNFWIGLLLIQVFAFTLGWFPAMGSEGWQSLVLPAVTMAIPTAAVLAQVLTRSFDDTLGESYIATARAKGLEPVGGADPPRLPQRGAADADDPRPARRSDRHRLDRRGDRVLAKRRRAGSRRNPCSRRTSPSSRRSSCWPPPHSSSSI